MSGGRSRRVARGITLIELMIAVAIVGILTAIAYPSYQAHVRRGNRAEAKTEMMEISQEMEKCYTRFGVYNNGGCATFTAIANQGGRLSENARYLITFAPNSVGRNTYTLVANLQPGFGLDPECGTLSLTEAGTRGRTGQGMMNRCW